MHRLLHGRLHRGPCRLHRLLCRSLRLALEDGDLQLLHVGRGKHITGGSSGLIGQLMVDGDHILHQQNHHHQQLIAEANDNGTQNDVQQSHAAHPFDTAAPVISLDIEQLHHTVEDNESRREDVQRLQDLFHHKKLEAAKVLQESAKGIHFLTALFRHDEDERQHRCGNRKNSRDGKENYLMHRALSFSMFVLP